MSRLAICGDGREYLCHSCHAEPVSSHGGRCSECGPALTPRCANCGHPWPKAGTVCDQKCSASYAATLATFAIGACTDRERDAAEAEIRRLDRIAEDQLERERWRTGKG